MEELDIVNVRILLIEDNQGYLDRIIRRLKRFGYQSIDTACNETEARERLDRQHFDVIVADMRLDENDNGGFAVVEEVRARNITSMVIVLTANDNVADCRKALRGGACWDYISKTMQERSALEELHDSIQTALRYLNRWGTAGMNSGSRKTRNIC